MAKAGANTGPPFGSRFQPVPDDMFGWRLHMADIAINKALAAADAAKSEIMPIWP